MISAITTSATASTRKSRELALELDRALSGLERLAFCLVVSDL